MPSSWKREMISPFMFNLPDEYIVETDWISWIKHKCFPIGLIDHDLYGTICMICVDKIGRRYAKRSLMAWVIVVPKEGRVCVAVPTLILVWHRLFQKKLKEKFKKIYNIFFLQKILKSRCHTKRRAGAATRARPSFGMTQTQDIRDLFAWRCPNVHDLANTRELNIQWNSTLSWEKIGHSSNWYLICLNVAR